MNGRRWIVRGLSLAAALVLGAGCHMPRSAYEPKAQFPTIEHSPGAAPTPTSPPATMPGAAPEDLTTAPLDPVKNTADVMAEVQRLGRTNPQAQQALLQELSRAETSMWPQVVEVFRSSMAYAEQSAARDQLIARQQQPEQPSYAATSSWAAQPASYPTASPSPATSEPRGRLLPPSGDSPMLMARYAADLADKYPDTVLPQVRLASNEMGEPASRSGQLAPGSSPAVATGGAVHDWRTHLATTIRTMETQGAAAANAPSATDQATLRLLYLAAGMRDEALRPVVSEDRSQQEFWTSELLALSALLEPGGEPADPHRKAEAARRLQEAASILGRSADLGVRNLAFCTEVTSFGVYKPFDRYAFKPGQETLLYAEVENFTSDATEKGFHTALRSGYEIFDAEGRVVAKQDFAVTEEYCRNPRRDFFIRYFLHLPANIEPGSYTLRLAIDDVKNGKAGQASIAFDIANQK